MQVVWLGWMPGETDASFAAGWGNSFLSAMQSPPRVFDHIAVLTDTKLVDPADGSMVAALVQTLQVRSLGPATAAMVTCTM